MWESCIWTAQAVGLSSAIVLFLMMDETAKLAPDSQYYRLLARGQRVPMPFCLRWMLPTLLGEAMLTWKLATLAGLVAQGVGIAVLAGDLRATLLLLFLPAGARFSLRHPLLVDPIAQAVAIWAAVALTVWPFWWVGLATGTIAALTRESAVIWTAVYAWSLWPLVVAPWIWQWAVRRHHRQAVPLMDTDWIVSPLWKALTERRGHWMNPVVMILPWGVILPLALWGDPWRTCGYVLLASVPLMMVSDSARVYGWAAPMLIPIALAAPVPEMAWGLLLVAHSFNPYRGA